MLSTATQPKLSLEYWRQQVRLHPHLVTPKLNSWMPHTPTEKQMAFLLLPHREAFYGGAAGGGKTDALLMAALQWVERPDYAAVMFRRTYADLSLPGALMDRAHDWLQGTAAHWNETKKTWTFPSGATITFGYLETEKDKYRYQGMECQFCVEVGTLIRMADGTSKTVEDVREGDEVLTLEGARRVIRKYPKRTENCVRAVVYDGTGQFVASQVQSKTHRLLTPSGWHSYADIAAASHPCVFSLPRECRSVHRCASRSLSLSPNALLFHDSQESDWAHLPEFSRLSPGHQCSLGFCVCAAQEVPGSDFVMSRCIHQEEQPPALVSAPVVLHAYPLRSAPVGWPDVGQSHEVAHARSSTSLADLPDHYSTGFDHDDARFHRGGVADQEHLLRQDGVGQHNPSCCGDGVWAQTQKYSHHTIQYVHPYTMDIRQSSEDISLGSVDLIPCGECVVVDLTISEVSHYITTTGLVNQNCAFDELTQFNEAQYLYLFSRLRRRNTATIPLRMRCASNPGGEGHSWVYERFVAAGKPPDRVFISAKLDDNPHLDQAEYRKSLINLDYITQAQLLEGLWVTDPAGKPFKREVWANGQNRYHMDDSAIRNKVVARYISFDTALKANETSAYTACVVGELWPDYRIGIREVWRDKLEFPDLPDAMLRMANRYNADGKLAALVIEDKISGTSAYQTLMRSAPQWIQNILIAFQPSGDKPQRWSQAALWCKRGCVQLPHPGADASWLYEFEQEIFNAPDSTFLDQADAFAQLIIYCENLLADGWWARGEQ